jgi:uncharacterized protein
MRTSTYEIFLPLIGTYGKPIEGRALLLNGLYGAVDVVTQEEREIIAAGEFDRLPSPVFERLSFRGHITRKTEEEEIADMRLLSRIHRAIPAWNEAWLVIMPTYDCNFRCPYCYEQHRLKNGKEWLSSVMAGGTMDAVFAAVDDHKARGFAFASCVFYGGEPFLEKNREVVRRIAENCKARGIKIQAVTNGYELESFLDCIEEYRFDYLQVTVDGTAELNDRRRLHKNGLPTYDRILSNVEQALQRGVGIRLRVNVGRDNLHGIGALIDDLKARGFIEKEKARVEEEKKLKEKDKNAKTGRGHFHYFFKAAYDDAHPEKNVSEQAIIDELMKIGFTAEEASRRERQYIQFAERLSRLFRKESLPQFSPVYCDAETGLVVVDPFGKVYSCFDAVAKVANSVGYVDRDLGRFLWNFNRAKWRVRTTDNMEACHACPYAFICRGGCAFRANYEHGSYFREHCGEIREIVAFVASHMAGKEWEKNHDEEMTLSLAGSLSQLTAAERETIMTTKSPREILRTLQTSGLFACEEEKGV